MHQNESGRENIKRDLVDLYIRRFPNLRPDIEEFGEFQSLKPHNYDVSTEDRMANLVNNLSNTEIDVVLESPKHLFIGKAKHKMSFNGNGILVLVHQLIRQ